MISQSKISRVLSQVLEVREEAASAGSDSESVLSWTLSKPAQKDDVTASGKKCLSAIFNEVRYWVHLPEVSERLKFDPQHSKSQN